MKKSLIFLFFCVLVLSNIFLLFSWHNVNDQKRNIQSQCQTSIDSIIKKFQAETFNLDSFDAKVIPKSNIVKLGQSYEAEIVLAAYRGSGMDTRDIVIGEFDTLRYEFIGKKTRVPTINGSGKYIVRTDSLGIHKFEGTIGLWQDSLTYHQWLFGSNYAVVK